MVVPGRLRAGAVGVVAGAALLLLALHRPGALVARPDDPTSGVVGAAGWVAWGLAAYLALGFGTAAAAHVAGGGTRPGRFAELARRTSPRCVRRLVEVVVGATAAAAVLAGAGPVAAYADPPRPSLDWPGLSAPATPAAAARAPTATPPAPRTPVALVSSHPRRHSGPPAELVVRAGDSLWTLASRQLGAGASAAEIAAAWPRLYAANRAVIGTDPNLIHPGQRLVPPAPDFRRPR